MGLISGVERYTRDGCASACSCHGSNSVSCWEVGKIRVAGKAGNTRAPRGAGGWVLDEDRGRSGASVGA